MKKSLDGTPKMEKVIIFGAGSIGTVLAYFMKLSSLLSKNFESSHIEIHLIGRKEKIGSIVDNGLKFKPFSGIEITDKEKKLFEKPIKNFFFHETIEDCPEADIIFLSMKTTGLVNALKGSKNYVSKWKKKPIVCITMNGLGLRSIVNQYFPDDNIIESVVGFPAHLEKQTTNDKIDINKKIPIIIANTGGNKHFIFQPHKYSKYIFSKLFDHAPYFEYKILPTEEEFRQAQWKKGIMNIGMNAISAITQLTVGEVLKRETLGILIKHLINETLTIARKEGICISENMIEYFWEFAGKDPTHHTSTYYDLLFHKPTEIPFMNGVIVELGEKHNLPTPVNKAILDLSLTIEREFSFEKKKE